MLCTLKVSEQVMGDKEVWPVKDGIYQVFSERNMGLLYKCDWTRDSAKLHFSKIYNNDDVVDVLLAIANLRIPNSGLNIDFCVGDNKWVISTTGTGFRIQFNPVTNEFKYDPIVYDDSHLLIKQTTGQETFSIATTCFSPLTLQWVNNLIVVSATEEVVIFKTRITYENGQEPRCFNWTKFKPNSSRVYQTGSHPLPHLKLVCE